jgi:hypothetical protein
MDQEEDFYQLQQVAMVRRPELGGWCLAFWLLASLLVARISAIWTSVLSIKYLHS